MKQEQKKKRKFSRVKKEKRAKREACIVSHDARCPRCGETVAIILEQTFTSGKRRFLCVSEQCKKNSIRGKGRRFIVPVGKINCKKND